MEEIPPTTTNAGAVVRTHSTCSPAPQMIERWFIWQGTKRFSGPYDTMEEADRWAQHNLEKGKTYYLQKEEDVF